jgi:hypothetical protein
MPGFKHHTPVFERNTTVCTNVYFMYEYLPKKTS